MVRVYATAVRQMLPDATLTADLFHVVQLAVEANGNVRCRRSGDPQYGIKSLLVRNLEHLSPSQFAKIIYILDHDRYRQEIAAAWIAKENPGDALNLRARVTGSTLASARYAADSSCSMTGVPSTTTSSSCSPWPRRRDEITAAVITGITNAPSESLNRLAKLEACLACWFRNPRNQQRRIRIADTRGYRCRSHTATTARTRAVTDRNSVPVNLEDPVLPVFSSNASASWASAKDSTNSTPPARDSCGRSSSKTIQKVFNT
jgi:transposase